MQDNGNGQLHETVAEEEREELFPDLPGDETTPSDVFEATRLVKSIRELDERKSRVEEERRLQLQRYSEWYDNRLQKLAEHIERRKASLEAYLNWNSLQRLPTPEGTAYFRTTTKLQWPVADKLVQWAERNLPAALRVKKDVDKRIVGEHIKKTGELPEGYSEEQITGLYIR